MRKSSIHFNNVRLPLVDWQGLRVVTFDMIDEVHQRPTGTARAAFNRNRQHFIEGEDYVRVSPDAYRAMTACANVKRTRKKSPEKITGDVTLFFESGYLMLVKSFRDNLAWDIQRHLVRHYFRAVPEFPELHHVVVPGISELQQMPLAEAQHTVARLEGESFREHGQRGSQSMSLRRKEKKKLIPVLAIVQGWSQPLLTGFDAACGEGDV